MKSKLAVNGQISLCSNFTNLLGFLFLNVKLLKIISKDNISQNVFHHTVYRKMDIMHPHISP